MRILCLGDVVGEPGRRLMEAHLPELRREYSVDFVVVNGENAAHGHGITERIANDWFENLGVDVITTGNTTAVNYSSTPQPFGTYSPSSTFGLLGTADPKTREVQFTIKLKF